MAVTISQSEVDDVAELTRDGVRALLASVRETSKVLRKAQPMDIVDWARANVITPASMSPDRAGPFKPTAIQAAMLRAWQEPGVSRIALPKPPRLGITLMYVIALMYMAFHEGDDVLYTERKDDAAQTTFKDTLLPLIEASPVLRAMRRTTRSGARQDTWQNTYLTNGAIYRFRSVTGDGFARQFKARWMFPDESGDPAYRSGRKDSEGDKIALMARRGQQITGSIIGTSLFGLGLAIVVGSFGRDRQVFKRERAGQLSSMLVLVMVALLLPAVFNMVAGAHSDAARLKVTDEDLSIGVSIVLILLYLGNLLYTLVTHRDVFASGDARGGGGEGGWPLPAALGTMVAATAAIALEAELVSGALKATATSLGLSAVFLGVIVLALVGTVSDVFAAVFFARQDKMGLVLSICVGSAIQVALVVAPLLVLASWAMGHPMTLVFGNPLDLFAIAAATFTVNAIAADGETTWFEGVLLIGVYALLALAFFFAGG